MLGAEINISSQKMWVYKLMNHLFDSIKHKKLKTDNQLKTCCTVALANDN